MASSSTTQDEDLLIISEDTMDSPTDLDFSFNFEEDASSKPLEDSHSSSSLQESSTQTTAETSASLGDFSFDVFSQSTQTPAISPELEVGKVPESSGDVETSFSLDDTVLESPVVQETSTQEMTLAQDVFPQEMTPVESIQEAVTPVYKEDAQETLSTGDVSSESLNDILSSTIAKLVLRAETIAQDSSAKTSHIVDIKEQIKVLEDQVASLEGDIGVLHAEAEKISKNIDALEGMKLDPVKEHNARRVVKK